MTLEILIFSTILSFILSFLVGFARLSRYRTLRIIMKVYVEIFRGSSLFVQMFWLFYVLPLLGISWPAVMTGVLAIGLNYGAYGSEVVRSNILAVPKGQTEASIALNMNPTQRMFLVIVPQAFMRMIPPFGNLLIELLKSTPLVSLITISDLTYETMQAMDANLSETGAFLISLMVVYYLIASVLNLGMRRVEKRATEGRS